MQPRAGLITVEAKVPEGVCGYLQKLAKRDLSLQSLPLSLAMALAQLNPSASEGLLAEHQR